MGNRSSLLLRKEEIAQIRNETGFTANQIERLYSRFTSLDRGDLGTLSREDLLRIPELAINPLGERIVDLFHMDSGNNCDRINFLQFMRVLSKFRPIRPNKENNRMEKVKFAFDMYDIDNDGLISKDELLVILHMMVGANISEEQLSIIADKTISEADINGDGLISFEEFSKTFEKSDIEHKMSIRFLN
ncbi:calcineurin B homologous protein 1 [Sipha flava]|uniref:Calcineurin B homologous protein 1 n=1 Tax=Sipha flava TaxID=143950 RepID=A0A8B8G1S6_9HEMI|nr:calcineurin B homologous protein 1 [Sipha flava]